ncbi:MAG TPA: C40 family peptidase [Mycobacteriales bacterium]|nr:C40 family peptidase [Mycobacteriales bacterium]
MIPSDTWTRRRLVAGGAALAVALAGMGALLAVPSTSPARSREAASIDAANLRLAADAIVGEARAAGALNTAPTTSRPAAALLTAVYALIDKARPASRRTPTNTRSIMGPVPHNLSHPLHPRLWHRHVTATHTMRRFHHPVAVGGSVGWGLSARHDHVRPARPQPADGVYVDPRLPPLPPHPTVAAVAIRAALKKLGHPYVWAAAGPDTFDCSGLVRWAYGHAGRALVHYTGTQWNQGRLIRPSQVLPGDLVLFYRSLSHVGIYLGAGWMVNAPFTGHYVDVVPVHGKVAGIVRP